MHHGNMYTQGDSRVVGITVGDAFLGLCHQKSSYQHGPYSHWLRRYWCTNLTQLRQVSAAQYIHAH
jgi:hypothetical protein